MIYRIFVYWRLLGNRDENFLLNVLCSINIKNTYTKTIPSDVAMPATDVPMLVAIFVMFGNRFASNRVPSNDDMYLPKSINLCCNSGSARTSSANIGWTWVINSIIKPIVDDMAKIPEIQSNMYEYMRSFLVFGVLYGNNLRQYSAIAFIKYHKNAATNNGIKIERPNHSSNIDITNRIIPFIDVAFSCCVPVNRAYSAYFY